EAETKTGLEQPEMGLPRKPHGEAATGVQALVRAAPLGMLPQVEADWVTNMSHQVAVLTHGDWQTPAAYSLLMHHISASDTHLTAVSKVISGLTDHVAAQRAGRIRASLGEEISAPATAQGVLAAAIRSVTDGLEQAVAPEQVFSAAITSAVHRG